MPPHFQQGSLLLSQLNCTILQFSFVNLNLPLQIIDGFLRQIGLRFDITLLPSYVLSQYPYLLSQLSQVILKDYHFLFLAPSNHKFLFELLYDQVALIKSNW